MPARTITVTETFADSNGAVLADANVKNAFSNSVEVKVTDTGEDSSNFGFVAGTDVYPFDISLYIKGTNTKTEPASGYAVTLSLPIPEDLLDVREKLIIAHKAEDGTVTIITSSLNYINGVWYLVFDATEFSPYALVVSNLTSYDKHPLEVEWRGARRFCCLLIVHPDCEVRLGIVQRSLDARDPIHPSASFRMLSFYRRSPAVS